MRLRRLDLIAFGHFTNARLDFAERPGMIDLVYGDNEAGKSTSRRAVSSFLFGIPLRTTDDFVHSKPTMRVGAEAVDDAGNATTLVRRKGAKATLRDKNDNVVDDEVLGRMLGGLDRELFEQMFALSRDLLVSGGNDLLAGKGSLGEALFGASLGLASVHEVLRTLEDEAASIFRPGGSVPTLNAKLRELEDLRREARAAELRPSEYLAHQAARESALFERSSVDARLVAARAEMERLDRQKRLLPLMARRNAIGRQIEELGPVVVLSPTARQERLDAVRERERAGTDITTSEQQINDLSDQLERLRPDKRLLERADEIGALHTEIGGHRKAARDLPGLGTQRRAEHERANALLAQTFPDRTLDDVDQLRLTVAERAEIASLGSEYGRVNEAARRGELQLSETRGKLERALLKQAALSPLADIGPTVVVLGEARTLGAIERIIADEQTKLRASEGRLRSSLASLPLFVGTIDELRALPAPLLSSVARFEAAHDAISELSGDLMEEAERVASEAASNQERLNALRLSGDVPSEGDLDIARAKREEDWQAIRRDLLPDRDQHAGSASPELLDAYEARVGDVDDIADRLRREADRVAAQAEIAAALDGNEQALASLNTHTAELDADRARLNRDWEALWEATSIAPLSPPEMHDWLERREALVEEASAHEELRSALAVKIALRDEHRDALRRELGRLGREVGNDETLSVLIALVEDTIEDHRAREKTHERALDLVASLEEDLDEAQSEAQRALSEREAWTGSWGAAVACLGGGHELSPEQARSIVEALGEVFAAREQARGFESRIESIERDRQTFAEAAGRLVDEIAPDLGGLSAEQQVTQLQQLVAAAQADAAKAEEVQRQLDEAHEDRDASRERQEGADAELQRLIAAAGCTVADELEQAEERSMRADELREQLQLVEAQILETGAASAAEVAAELGDRDLTQIETTLNELEMELDRLSEERRELDETVGQERALLREMARGDGAADAVAAAESTRATIREQAEQYARLRLAVAVIRGEIDRFREESHGPLLARAGDFFARITCQDYSGIAPGFDERGEIVLLGRRPDGREVTVDEMSDGTRDQLYLALRLATIEQQVEQTAPLPLIADDLFLNFDDHRAAAAFEVLAEIALTTQVVFFTHHHHLIEAATKALRPDQWRLQELGAPRSAVEAAA
jgi:uncharacterized protein YhaN